MIYIYIYIYIHTYIPIMTYHFVGLLGAEDVFTWMCPHDRGGLYVLKV